MTGCHHPASFRDPSGYIFVDNNTVYRQIKPSYFDIYEKLFDSGLYDGLISNGWLVAHEVIERQPEKIVIKPEQIPLITYPHEWSFSQIKDAALLTLNIHLKALDHGMVLKDATAFNVQFMKGRPIFIDTLSFDHYNDGAPWAAYGQFCRHFLSPLLLMKYISPDLGKLHVLHIDGVPLDIVSSILPFKTHFNLSIKANIHLHAKSFNRHKEAVGNDKQVALRISTHRNIVSNMINYIKGLTLASKTEWGEYYTFTNYNKSAFEFKEKTIKGWVEKYRFKKIWDIGGNNGHFSRLIMNACDMVVCTDIDPVAVEANYCIQKTRNEEKMVPLVIDFTNPSPGIGFNNEERSLFKERINDTGIDCVLALALIHHLTITANCSFEMLASSFSQYSQHLIIEFIDPDDSWAEKMLRNKRGAKKLFDFSENNFKSAFKKYYEVLDTAEMPKSKRRLYLMLRQNN